MHTEKPLTFANLEVQLMLLSFTPSIYMSRYRGDQVPRDLENVFDFFAYPHKIFISMQHETG